MKMKVFQYALVLVPQDEEKKEEFIKVDYILGRDEKDALVKAARLIPKDYEDRLEEINVVLRPF